MFAVAHKVAIFSNGFNFSLDRTQPLGMVCPTILDNRGYEREEMSVIVLYLSLDDDEFQELKKDLEGLNGDILLFTHRLRRIDILLHDKQLLSHAHSSEDDSVHIIVTEQRNYKKERRYVRHAVKYQDLPHHDKRRGGSSEIVLAFPFNDDGPIVEAQSVFAFLPLQRKVFSVSFPLILLR